MLAPRVLLSIAGIFGFSGVALGAFAAHGLKASLSPYLIGVFETGVLYQFVHTFAIVASAVLILVTRAINARKWFCYAAICFIIGILFFSGSLYLLAITGVKWFGPITPLGGLFFMLGWALFIKAALTIDEETQ